MNKKKIKKKTRKNDKHLSQGIVSYQSLIFDTFIWTDPFILNESTKQHTFTWKKGAGKIVEEGFEKKKWQGKLW